MASAFRRKLATLGAGSSSITPEPEVCGISLEDYGAGDVIEISPDRQKATARLHVALHTETEIGPACTVVDMARQQGNGIISASQPVVLKGMYARDRGNWKIVSVRFAERPSNANHAPGNP